MTGGVRRLVIVGMWMLYDWWGMDASCGVGGGGGA